MRKKPGGKSGSNEPQFEAVADAVAYYREKLALTEKAVTGKRQNRREAGKDNRKKGCNDRKTGQNHRKANRNNCRVEGEEQGAGIHHERDGNENKESGGGNAQAGRNH